MSRCATRARKRAARLADRRAAFASGIDARLADIARSRTAAERVAATERMLELLGDIASSDVELWPFRDRLCRHAAGGKETREDVEAARAVIAQIVNRRLAGCTPGNVRRRHDLAE